MCQIIDWARQRRKMQYPVYLALDFERSTHILLNELEAVALFKMRQIFAVTRYQVIESEDLMASFDESVAQM